MKAVATKVYFKSDDIAAAMRVRYAQPEWSVFFEVRDSTGFAGKRSADAVAMNCYPSRGLEIHGFEFKVSRGDWLSELRNPEKSAAVQQYCDRWFVVAPTGVVQNGERPATWGEIEYQGGTRLRLVADAPKLEAQPLPRAFIASLLRASCNVSAGQVARMMEPERERLQKSYDERLERELEHRRDNGAGALEKAAKIKELTGIDLLHWESAEKYAAAIKMALATDVNGYHGLAYMVDGARRFVQQSEQAAAELGIELKVKD